MICKESCKDCGKEISKLSKRCKSCANINRKGKYTWSKEAADKRKDSGNVMWKGKDANINSIHRWVERRKIKPEFCEKCHIKKPFDLANISQEYKRDINDFEWLCRSCHMKSDGRMKNLKQNSKYIKNG